jgi:quinol monooxygenase YgiN
MDPHLHLVVHVHAKPGEAERVRAVLQSLLAPSRAGRGCLRYEPLADQKEAHPLTLVETRASRADWEAHMTTPHVARLGTDGAPLAASWTIAEASRVA